MNNLYCLRLTTHSANVLTPPLDIPLEISCARWRNSLEFPKSKCRCCIWIINKPRPSVPFHTEACSKDDLGWSALIWPNYADLNWSSMISPDLAWFGMMLVYAWFLEPYQSSCSHMCICMVLKPYQLSCSHVYLHGFGTLSVQLFAYVYMHVFGTLSVQLYEYVYMHGLGTPSVQLFAYVYMHGFRNPISSVVRIYMYMHGFWNPISQLFAYMYMHGFWNPISCSHICVYA